MVLSWQTRGDGLKLHRGESDWVAGTISSQEELCCTGIAGQRALGSPSWRCSTAAEMWHWGTCSVGTVRWVGVGALRGLLLPS